MPVRKRWRLSTTDSQAEELLRRELGVHPVTARLLAQRGLTSPEAASAFLNPRLSSLPDPFLLPDAEAACERLKRALAGHEKILVHGDYDGDGVTSAALWTRYLRALGGDVDVFVPHRRRDGYDIRTPIIEQAKSDGVGLIVTTDCGIQRVDEVEHARSAGIDVIVTDHHTPNANGALPRAVAVVNPHRRDSRYPFRDLAGVGVAFRLCEALTRTLGLSHDSFRRSFLDLAAIGTVTDVMPLVGENRIIVKYGLQALQHTRKPGLRALIEAAGYQNRDLDVTSIAFGLGPRLNSASRVDETQIALDLLLTKSADDADRLARQLNALNSQRREVQDRIFEEAMAQVAQMDSAETRCLVLSSAGWSGGVIGIVASKIVERMHRPCVVIALDEAAGAGRGSARSIHAFNMYDAISACGDLLIEFGGHAHAAGLAIDTANITDFAAQMNVLANQMLTDEDCVPTVDAAMELDPTEICPELVDQIALLAPFGSGNPEPLFVSRGVHISQVKRMGTEKQHLKLLLRVDGLNGNDNVDALWWHRGEFAEMLETCPSIDLCFRAQVNHWNGRRSIQFGIEDLQPPEW